MGVLPQSHLVRGFIHSCLQHAGKMKSSVCLLCVIKEERLEKIPMTFCCTRCLRKDMLSVARPHSMLILKMYMQKFETGGFIDPGRKSRFRTGVQKKIACFINICSCFIDEWMRLACVVVLSCLSSEFACILFLGNYSFKSWLQGRQLKSHVISSILFFTEFLSLGSWF